MAAREDTLRKRHSAFPLLAGASAKLTKDPTGDVRGFAELWATL